MNDSAIAVSMSAGASNGTTLSPQDTRVVTYSSALTNCRSSALQSDQCIASTLDLVSPAGTANSLAGPIEFTMQLSGNCSALNDLSSLVNQCGMAAVLPAVQCSYWNVTSQSLETNGCAAVSIVGTTVTCRCDHLTEFTILLSENDLSSDLCTGYAPSIGYLILMLSYCLVGVLALVQLLRLAHVVTLSNWYLMSVSLAMHALMLVLCTFRAMELAVFYTWYKTLSFGTQAVLVGLPYSVYGWIYWMVIIAWRAAAHTAQTAANKRKSIQNHGASDSDASSSDAATAVGPLRTWHILLFNGIVSFTLVMLYALLPSETTSQQTDSSQGGALLQSILQLCFCVGLTLYGSRLWKLLGRSGTLFARKLLGVGAGLVVLFLASTLLLLTETLASDLYAAHELALDCSYFTMDILAILLVLLLFARSVGADLDRAERTRPSRIYRLSGFRPRRMFFWGVQGEGESQAEYQPTQEDQPAKQISSVSSSISESSKVSASEEPPEQEYEADFHDFADGVAAPREVTAAAVVGGLAEIRFHDSASAAADPSRPHGWNLYEVLEANGDRLHVREATTDVEVQKREHCWVLMGDVDISPIAGTHEDGTAAKPPKFRNASSQHKLQQIISERKAKSEALAAAAAEAAASGDFVSSMKSQ